MANGKTKYKRKMKGGSIFAQQFDASKDPEQWPDGIEENTESPTGYSFGNIEIVKTEDKYKELNNKGEEVEKTVQVENREGFFISDTDYLIDHGEGKYSRMDSENFLNKYDLDNL